MNSLAFAVAALLSGAAQAADRAPVVTGAHFFAYDTRNIRGGLVETNRVPHRPVTSCYRWVIAVEAEDRALAVRELFELPASAEHWDRGPDRATIVGAEGSSAVTEFQDSLSDGLLQHGWCVAPGDPTGPHRIRVFIGDRLLHEFRFEVVGETF